MSDVKDTAKLMDINNLRYEETGELALVESGGVFKINNFDNNSYASNLGSEIVCTLQSSNDFVYGPNCYLRMDIEAKGLVVGTTGATDYCALGFLNTPATSIFSRMALEDRSGAEIERVESINKAVRNCLPWKYPDDYRRTVQMAGQYPNRAVGNTAALVTAATPFAVNVPSTPATASALRVCIPLWYFSGLFKEETLIPPQLISGMRFRLTLANAQQAFSIIASGNGATPTGFDASSLVYTITDPVIMLDTYALASSVQNNILEQSQSPMGLPYVYETLYEQIGNAGINTSFTQQVNKAVARAEKMWTVTQNATIAESAAYDDLGTKELSYFQYQSRVGDWYAPYQVLQCGTTDSVAGVQRNCAELFANNLQNSQWDVYGMSMPSGLSDPYRDVSTSLVDFRSYYSLSDATGATGGNGANAGNGVIVQSLNQSPHIGSAGIAINNSRTAEVRLRYAQDDGISKRVLTWLQYIKIASVYPSRTVIKQ